MLGFLQIIISLLLEINKAIQNCIALLKFYIAFILGKHSAIYIHNLTCNIGRHITS